jgi:hypothetical protein
LSLTAEVWEHDGRGVWLFVSVSEADANDLEEMFDNRASGFGSAGVTMGTKGVTDVALLR